jgi:hypothetical protein
VAVRFGVLAKVSTEGTTPSEPLAEGMGLGMNEVELDGRRGRSFRLSSDGTGKQRQNQSGSAMPAGTRALQWGKQLPD